MPAAAMHKRQKEIDAILSMARTVISFVGASPLIPSSILLSIGVLGESLTWLRIVLRSPSCPVDYSWPIGLESGPESSITETKHCLTLSMLEDGWCPIDLKLLQGCTPSAWYFVSNMRAPRGGPVHLTCSESRCELLQVQDDHEYVVRHTTHSCDCSSFSADPDTLYSILKRGNLPLIVPPNSKGHFPSLKAPTMLNMSPSLMSGRRVSEIH